jgi:hypothetical protein
MRLHPGRVIQIFFIPLISENGLKHVQVYDYDNPRLA